MTGNVALDIAIGLVFTYLLYSLFASIIMEIVLVFLGIRAWNLRFSIYRMLRDEKSYGRLLGFFITTGNSLLIWAGFTPNKRSFLFNKFFRRPNIKRLAEGGFFSKPSYLSSENFSKALVESLKEGQIGTNELSKIQQGINNIPAKTNRETKEHIQGLLEEANNDLKKFKFLLEQWYDDTQERAIGWFKRKTQVILLFIGFYLATAFNLNTIDIAKKLSVDKEARDQMVQLAIAYTEKYNQSNDGTKVDYKDQLDSLNQARKFIQTEINQANSVLAIKAPETMNPMYKCFWEPLECGFGGILLTALAISLGAPFWFDLLNRFVKLRSAVQQPVTKASSQKKIEDVSLIDRKG